LEPAGNATLIAPDPFLALNRHWEGEMNGDFDLVEQQPSQRGIAFVREGQFSEQGIWISAENENARRHFSVS
jgi:hypothetical protein